MRDLVVKIFGEYVPLLQVDKSVYVSGLAGVDWTWIAGVCLFAVVLLSFFKIVGVLLKK